MGRQWSPRVTSLPRISTSSYLEAKRRLSSGCSSVITTVATVVMTLEQPLDKRLFASKYDDVEILGKLVTRGDHWRPIGFALRSEERRVGKECRSRWSPYH